VKERTRLGGGV